MYRMIQKSIKFVETVPPCNYVDVPTEMGAMHEPLWSQNNEKHHTEYCSLCLFNNIGKAILHCGTEGRTQIYEKSLVIQTLSRDQTFCPSHALEWKRMENICRLLFDPCDFFETPSYYCRDNNHSTWSPFCTQKNFIAPRRMSSNSPARVQKSHVLHCQVHVAAIMLCTVSGKNH